MNIAYVRVSTEEQNEQRQLDALKNYDIEKWFIEKVSAKNMNRPKLQEMLGFVREGDTIYIVSFDRLARRTKDLLSIVEQLESKSVALVSCKENIDSNTPTGKLMLTMIGAIAEFERQNILDRQREGIRIAKQQHKYCGRQKKNIDEKAFNLYYEEYMKRGITKKNLAIKLKLSRPTLDRYLKEKGLMQPHKANVKAKVNEIPVPTERISLSLTAET